MVMVMESMPTNKAKNKKKSLFMCFKPVACGVVRKHGATDPVLEYLAIADKNGVVSSSAMAEDEADEGGGRQRRKKGRDRWRSFRTAFNDTTMMKKISKRKANKETNSSMSRSSNNTMEGGEATTTTTNKIPNPQRKPTTSSSSRNTSNASSSTFSSRNNSNSSSSSAAFTSSASSSTNSSCSSSRTTTTTDHVPPSSSSSSHPEIISSPSPPSLNNNANGVAAVKQINNKQCGFQDDRKGKCCRCSNTVMCMFLVSLLVLILWGKFLAIFCTSIWFYIVRPSRRRPISCNNEGVLFGESNDDQCDSVQYKKKIIMEGLLDRSHSRVSLDSGSMPKLL